MIRDSLPSGYARLAQQIREAMQFGSAAAIAFAVPACGGNVVVDREGTSEGTGGSGGASTTSTSGTTSGTTTTTTTSTGSMSFTCNLPWPLVYACAPAQNGCPPAGSQAAIVDLGAQLNMWGPCPSDPDFCSCGVEVIAVPCGPDPAGQGCCYYVEMGSTMVCEGRPFVVEGHARVAAIVDREGWCAAVQLRWGETPHTSRPGRLDAGALDPAARAAIAEAWAHDARNEHASVASFARFVLELLALGAPADLIRAAQQAILDEIRHAEICFGIASALSGKAIGPSPLPIEGALGGRSDAAAIAAAVVREGCVGETLSALGALAARDAATHPAVRAALDEIAEDEAAHAALAWRTAAWLWAAGDRAVRAAMERAFAEAGPPAAPVDGATDPDPDVAHAFGRLSSSERRAVAARGLAEVVRPSAAALLGATDMERPARRFLASVPPSCLG